MGLFTGKTMMITGGTGSFGNAVLNRFLETDIGEIRIFSRYEKKQDDMRHAFQAGMPQAAGKLKFFLGDVRDLQSVKDVIHGVDYVFHAAALKQVPSCEFFPMEAVRTNVMGTEHVLTAAIEAEVACVVCLSTDKAAYPVNVMGLTKALEERVAQEAEAYGLKWEIAYCDEFPETSNHPDCVRKVRQAAGQLGLPLADMPEPARASEDFGWYLREIPGALFFIGNGMDYPPLHSIQFDFPDQEIATVCNLFRALVNL